MAADGKIRLGMSFPREDAWMLAELDKRCRGTTRDSKLGKDPYRPKVRKVSQVVRAILLGEEPPLERPPAAPAPAPAPAPAVDPAPAPAKVPVSPAMLDKITQGRGRVANTTDKPAGCPCGGTSQPDPCTGACHTTSP